MTCYYHGDRRKYPYFEGWYLKHQHGGRTIAFIPAIHINEEGIQSASIQVITDEGAWYMKYPIEACRFSRKTFQIRIGNNVFSEKGIRISIQRPGLYIDGKVSYGAFQRIRYDIMGWFRYFPVLQCTHGVLSMGHELTGSLNINGELINLTGGTGYIETDRGHSFPSHYLWTQCSFGDKREHSIMLSAADVPLFGKSILGCICAVFYKGKEYRIATYLGARVRTYEDGTVVITQGKMKIKAKKLGERAFALHAPRAGSMNRMIRESPACKVRYQFVSGGHILFDVTSSQASFEQAR